MYAKICPIVAAILVFPLTKKKSTFVKNLIQWLLMYSFESIKFPTFHFPIRSHVNSVSHLGFINQNSIKRLSTKKHELHAASITGMCQIYKKHELGAASITGMCQIYKKHELGAASITGMCQIYKTKRYRT